MSGVEDNLGGVNSSGRVTLSVEFVVRGASKIWVVDGPEMDLGTSIV